MSRHDTLDRPRAPEAVDLERQIAIRHVIGRGVVDLVETEHSREVALRTTSEIVPYEAIDNLPVAPPEDPGVLRVREHRQRELPPAAVAEVSQPITVGHIDLSDNAERKAHDIANRRIEDLKEVNNGRFLFHPKRIARNIWGYSATHRKIVNQTRERIIEAQDVNIVDEEFDENARKKYSKAIFNQFFNGSDEAIDTTAGENREFFAEDHEATVAMRDLYAEYARKGTNEHPAMTDDEFNDRVWQVRELMGEHESDTATGEVEQDNYLETARAVRGRIEHGEAVDDILEGFQLMRGEARSDARTEVHQTRTEELLDAYEKTRIGELVPSNVVAVAINIAGYVSMRGASAVAKLATLGGSALVVGAVAGVREGSDISKQRAQRERETFRGKEYENSTAREEALSEFEYERASVDDILERLGSFKERLSNAEDDNPTLVLRTINEIADIKVMKELSALKGIDLFDHGVSDDPTKYIEDRMKMAQLQSELKVLLQAGLRSQRDKVAEGGDRAILDMLGFADGDLTDEMLQAGIDSAIDDRVAEFQKTKLHEVEEKDEAFRKYRRYESLKKGVTVGASSLVAGAVIQEALSMVSSSRAGFVERAWGGQNVPDASNTLLNFRGNGVEVSHVSEKLSPTQITELQNQGSEVLEHHTTNYETVTGDMSVGEYGRMHPGELRGFDNVNFFDNNSRVSDLNELGGQLTRTPDGSVNMWDTMTSGGSFNAAGERIDMTRSDGNSFVMAFQRPDGTHDFKVFEYGQNVPKPYADMLYQNANGSWGFKGDGYIAFGQTADNSLNVAASIAGDGGPNTLTDVQKVPEVAYDYEIRTPVDRSTDVPPAVWLPGRSRLGNAQRPPRATPAPEPTRSANIEPIMPREPVRQRRSPVRGESVQAIESRDRQTAREAGWPLLDIQIGSGQNTSAEQWKAASTFVERARAEAAGDDITHLRRAAELAIEDGAGSEVAGLLSTLYAMNESRAGQSGRASTEEATTPNRERSTPQGRSGVETDTADIAARIGRMDDQVDTIMRLYMPEATKAGVTAAAQERIRQIYAGVVRQYGSDITDRTLTRRAAAEVHPDTGKSDDDLVRAMNWMNDRIRRSGSS